MFGTFACKLFRLLEHIGKIFSTFILVAFSIDRYCAVCHPLQVRVRNHRTVYTLLSAMFLFTCILLFPILLYAHSKELIIHEKFDVPQKTITRMHLYKCVDDLGDTLFIVFTLYCFLLAYLMPLLFMIYFYYGMLIRLFKQARAVRQTMTGRRKGVEEKIPIGHIAVYTLAICLFHFLCWTPYWVSVLYSLFIYFMYGVHALPYINSASNFILYGLLNRQLHQSPERKYTRCGGTHSAPALRLTDCSEMNNQRDSNMLTASLCLRDSPTRSAVSSAAQRLVQQNPHIIRSTAPPRNDVNANGHAGELDDLHGSCSMDEDSIVI
ncbi:hypothetical protein GCK32_000121 [Trichostrongylus colubriformis]|uniref:G-protein coupled receptors family 1 profile domain-containing protein n=1 Tax=Trichostrongylus colubriformis TaxID=6319 RepID=A0AAN8FZ31_TRICO